MEDKYISYLKQHFKEHKTINNISRGMTVIYEGETLAIGNFLKDIRTRHRLYVKGKKEKGCASNTSIERYKALDKMNLEWEPKKQSQKTLQENDKCLRFLQEYYKTNKSLDNLPDLVIFEGEELNIKSFCAHRRVNHRNYLEGKKEKGCAGETELRRYQALDEMKFDWTPTEKEDDKYIRYLNEHYKINKTINDISESMVVIFEDEELKIGSFIADRRKIRNRYLNNKDKKTTVSELELRRWKELDNMDFDWTPVETIAKEIEENEKLMIKYLKKHYQENGTINDITAKEEVIFEGRTHKVGVFLNDCRKKRQAYIEASDAIAGAKTSTALRRYQALDELDFDWRPSENSISYAKLGRKHGIIKKTLKKYTEKFGGDIDKAIKICIELRQYSAIKDKPCEKGKVTLKTIQDAFDINKDVLESILNRPSLRSTPPTKTYQYDETETLRQYCIKNGLNYTVILKAINLKLNNLCDEDLESLITRSIWEYKTNGQGQTSTWVYGKYGNETLVSHLLMSLNLDPKTILLDMSKRAVPIESAIENNCFFIESKQDYNYLEPLYHKVISFYKKVNTSKEYTPETAPEALYAYFENMVKSFHLTQEEFTVIKDAFIHYTEAITQYHLYEVGFEKDPDKKVEKIIKYHLDEDEIEEAFFYPLKFDKRVLIGRDSELYKRRTILKNLTVQWNYLSDEVKSKKITSYNLTPEEQSYINKTRNEIDSIKEKVYTKK